MTLLLVNEMPKQCQVFSVYKALSSNDHLQRAPYGNREMLHRTIRFDKPPAVGPGYYFSPTPV